MAERPSFQSSWSCCPGTQCFSLFPHPLKEGYGLSLFHSTWLFQSLSTFQLAFCKWSKCQGSEAAQRRYSWFRSRWREHGHVWGGTCISRQILLPSFSWQSQHQELTRLCCGPKSTAVSRLDRMKSCWTFSCRWQVQQPLGRMCSHQVYP